MNHNLALAKLNPHCTNDKELEVFCVLNFFFRNKNLFRGYFISSRKQKCAFMCKSFMFSMSEKGLQWFKNS